MGVRWVEGDDERGNLGGMCGVNAPLPLNFESIGQRRTIIYIIFLKIYNIIG
jgi:hypothetical protein